MTEDYLEHYGIIRRSGRYPWGSGENPYQRNKGFLNYVDDLRKQGLSETEIAKALNTTTTKLRAAKAIAKNENRKADEAQAYRLKEKGYSNVAIGKRMGINESSVRNLLDPSIRSRTDVLTSTANMLKENVDKRGYIDIGAGVENHIGVSPTRLSTAVAMLQEQGYEVHYVKVKQLGTGMQTTIKVLAPPETTSSEVFKNRDKIQIINSFSEDGGRSYVDIQPPLSISSDRVQVKYASEGGAESDGLMYVRPGVEDVSLGGSQYAQVRVAVDGTHYLKGMAVYSDQLPKGVDILFNTNKENTGNKKDVMRPVSSDPDNPFGATIKRQRIVKDSDGKERVTSVMNIVNEEGDWSQWSRSLSSQMLSKQSSKLAKQQLDLAYDKRKEQFDEINSLTNPTVKKKLLETFADNADSAAVKLQAHAMPRQSTSVILPVNSLKDTEIYAPSYRNGESVVLIRHPHGGIFEIPELRVNNRNKEARAMMGNARDAVGINSSVANRLSGADFDGDTVLVIPNNSRSIKTSPALKGLKDFDPREAYPGYEGMQVMSPRTKQLKMGDVSNLITDMTIKGASQNEIARAVRHSMVVIDAENHKLNWKQSAKDHGIAELKRKYQGSARSGASTIVSRASSEIRVPDRKPRPAAEGGPVDPKTGRKVYVETGETYVDKQGRTRPRLVATTRMAEATDAHDLSSGQLIETIYADHANQLKSLANEARRVALQTKPRPYSPSAREAYAPELASLKGKLNTALKNAPLERQAQLIANTKVSAKRQANPGMSNEEIRKLEGQELARARATTGARKQQVEVTEKEWEAIQSGAVSNNLLTQILNNTNLDTIKKLATPRTDTTMSPAMIARAQALLNSGHTLAEVADALGVSTSTISSLKD